MIEIKWIRFPACGNKTRTMIRKDTELRIVSSELDILKMVSWL